METDCESLWKKMIGKPYSGKLNVRFEVAGDGEVLWRTYTGTKLETADTAKGIPNVTRHSLTLPFVPVPFVPFIVGKSFCP